jgi:hypothetical protein
MIRPFLDAWVQHLIVGLAAGAGPESIGPSRRSPCCCDQVTADRHNSELRPAAHGQPVGQFCSVGGGDQGGDVADDFAGRDVACRAGHH